MTETTGYKPSVDWLCSEDHSSEAGSVRTKKPKGDADRHTVQDEDHLEPVSQRRGPSVIYPGLDDPL